MTKAWKKASTGDRNMITVQYSQLLKDSPYRMKPIKVVRRSYSRWLEINGTLNLGDTKRWYWFLLKAKSLFSETFSSLHIISTGILHFSKDFSKVAVTFERMKPKYYTINEWTMVSPKDWLLLYHTPWWGPNHPICLLRHQRSISKHESHWWFDTA